MHVPNLNNESKSSSHSGFGIATHIVSETIGEATIVRAVRSHRQNVVVSDVDELERAEAPFALAQDLRRLCRQQIHARFSEIRKFVSVFVFLRVRFVFGVLL